MLKSVKYLMISAISLITFCGCGGPQLSVADAQVGRGEYFDAAQTYRKLYKKRRKREEGGKRGKGEIKMGQ